MQHSGFYAVVLSALLLAGCATTIQLQIRKAPELSLNEVKKIRIEPFDISGQIHLDVMKGGHGVLGAVAGIVSGALRDKAAEMAYPAFRQAEWERLKQAVFKDGFYTLTEGPTFDAIITGTIQWDVNDDGDEKSYKDKDDRVIRYYEIQRKAEARVNFTVANPSGDVLGMSEVMGTAEKTVNADDRDRAQRDIGAWEDLVKTALARTEEPFLRKIAPYIVTEDRHLEDGEARFIKDGNQAAQRGDWIAAVHGWNQGLAGGSPKDRIAALYNLAIYNEVEGRLPEALDKFTEARKASGDPKYDNDRARISARMEEEKKLQTSPPPASGQE